MKQDGSIEAGGRNGEFLTTRWSMIRRATDPSSAEATEALHHLCANSSYPIYAFIRHDGRSEAEAKDLTQGFFEHLLGTELLGRADENRGRFRTFLIRSLQNFLRDEWRKWQAAKRGGGCELVSLDLTDAEGRYLHEPASNETPDQIFERSWAQNLMVTVKSRLREEFVRAGELERYEILHDSAFGEGRPYAELATQLGMSEGGVKTAVRRMRLRFEHLLRAEVRELVNNSKELEAELQHLARLI